MGKMTRSETISSQCGHLSWVCFRCHGRRHRSASREENYRAVFFMNLKENLAENSADKKIPFDL